MGSIPLPLREFLGSRIDLIDFDGLSSLIGVREGDVVDAKSALYGRSDKTKKELALDVVAFANGVGGLLLLGLDEVDDVIVGVPGLELPGDEISWMRQVITGRVVPYLECEIRSVPIPDSDRVVLVVAVDRSVNAPHAALRDGGAVRYVIRAGDERRQMHESEVADAYGRRFATGAQRSQRVADLFDSAPELELTADMAWLVVAAVPHYGGAVSLGGDARNQFRAFLQQVAGRLPQHPGHARSCDHVSTKMRRFMASDRHREDDPKYSTSLLEAHTDGAVLACLAVGRALPAQQFFDSIHRNDSGGADETVVFEENLVFSLLEALHLVGCHAAFTGANGSVDLVAGLVTPENGEMSLGQSRTMVPGALGVRRLPQTERAGHTLSIDGLAMVGPDLLAATWTVGSDLTSAFGHPEIKQFTLEGQLDWQFVGSGYRGDIGPWAKRQSIEVLNRPT